MLFARIDLHSEKQHFSEKVKCFFFLYDDINETFILACYKFCGNE